jgi:mRNA interferase YafQ
MLRTDFTNQFKRDYRLAVRRGLDIGLLDEAIKLIAAEIELPKEYRDHTLVGVYKGCHECHLKPDWLLIWQADKETAVFERTGTHSDLF